MERGGYAWEGRGKNSDGSELYTFGLINKHIKGNGEGFSPPENGFIIMEGNPMVLTGIEVFSVNSELSMRYL